jgi:hypothetical protein
MFEELEKYTLKGHFAFNGLVTLRTVCNAPPDKSGVYLVYAYRNGVIRLIYIGCSGKIKKNGSIFIRKGGLKGRLINGHQFGKVPRKKSWPLQMARENIESLDVFWYVTHTEQYKDCPRELENKLLKEFYYTFNNLPSWNNEF